MDQELPERTQPGVASFDTRPAPLERWIANLPILNTGETSKRLFAGLLEMNQQDLPSQQRFRALELLRPTVLSTLESLKRHYMGQPFPLPEKNHQVVELSKALLNQLAMGYRIAIADEANKSVFFKDKKLLATTVHRAMSHLGQVLLKAYYVYAPYPAGVWREIHQLYEMAEKRDLLHTTIKSDTDEPVPATIGGVYKQILLLALACPYRLRQGEVDRVYAALNPWSEQVSLEDFVEPRSPDQIFVTSLDSDEPPTYLVLRHNQVHRRDARLLDTAALADTIREELRALHKQQARNTDLSESMLRRLMLSWGVMPKRKFTRARNQSTAEVAMGLSAAHYFISGEQSFDTDSADAGEASFASRSQFEARETAEELHHVPDVWDLRDTQRLHADSLGVRMVDYDERLVERFTHQQHSEPAAPAPQYHTHRWKMLNVSAGGYCLLWDSSDTSPAEVGELIGIRDSQEPDTFHLSLGVIRWMKCNHPQSLELGVQMISPGAVAVGTRLADSRDSGAYNRSLLLPEIDAIGQPASLITPTLIYHVGDTVLVNSHGKEARVQLTKVVENTGLIAQFQFRPLKAASRDAAEPGQPAGSVADFESLWEDL